MMPQRYILALLAFLSLPAGSASAVTSPCVSPTGTWPTLQLSPLPAIQYAGLSTSLTVTATITTPSNNRNNCMTGLELTPGSSTGTLYGPGGAALNYTASGFFPWDPGWNRVNFNVPPNTTVSYSFTFTIPGGQSAPVGAYSASFNLNLFEALVGGNIQTAQFNIAANVTTTCNLPPPDTASLDFTPAISNGRIPAPVQQHVTFYNAGCNGPTRLTLSGAPMRVPSSNADALIPYTAHAVIGSQPLTLDTTTTSSVFTQTATQTGGGNIPLTITVPPTAVLPAGRYQSTLTVSLTPAQ